LCVMTDENVQPVDRIMWRVLHVRPRCEKKIAEFCRIQKLEHYLPLRRETKIYQRRKVTVEKPVFPGYVFAAFDRAGRLELLKTNTVVRILDPHDEARLIRELDQIRKALAVDATLGATDAVKEGRRVRITAGPFLGIEGIVAELKGAAKVVLNVEMIGRAVVVVTDRDCLEPAE